MSKIYLKKVISLSPGSCNAWNGQECYFKDGKLCMDIYDKYCPILTDIDVGHVLIQIYPVCNKCQCDLTDLNTVKYVLCGDHGTKQKFHICTSCDKTFRAKYNLKMESS